jgi:hypothetical protein
MQRVGAVDHVVGLDRSAKEGLSGLSRNVAIDAACSRRDLAAPSRPSSAGHERRENRAHPPFG